MASMPGSSKRYGEVPQKKLGELRCLEATRPPNASVAQGGPGPSPVKRLPWYQGDGKGVVRVGCLGDSTLRGYISRPLRASSRWVFLWLLLLLLIVESWQKSSAGFKLAGGMVAKWWHKSLRDAGAP